MNSKTVKATKTRRISGIRLVSLSVIFICLFCFSADAYIEGPWLWMIASGSDIESDRLAAASNGAVTESLVAEYGVNEGDSLGDRVWTRGRIFPEVECLVWNWVCQSDNVNSVVNRTGLSNDPGLNNYTCLLYTSPSPRD